MTITSGLKMIALPTLCLGLFVVAYIIASAPAARRVSLGMRGVKRRASLNGDGVWPSIEPLVRWLAARFELLIPDKLRGRVDAWLTRAGDPLGLGPFEAFGLMSLTGVLGLAAGLIHGLMNDRNPLAYMFISGVLGAALPYLRIDAIRDARAIRIQRGLPPTVDILCLGLSAGLDFPGSVRQFIEKSSSSTDPLVEEFSILLGELQLGKTRREALTLFADRNPTSAVKEFVGSVIQAEVGGMALAKIFKIQAESSRRRRSVAAEETAAKTGIRLMMPMMLIFASVLIILVGPIGLQLRGVFG